jgi:hypothetical protein
MSNRFFNSLQTIQNPCLYRSVHRSTPIPALFILWIMHLRPILSQAIKQAKGVGALRFEAVVGHVEPVAVAERDGGLPGLVKAVSDQGA